MILKAGTYTFNNVVDVSENLSQNINIIENSDNTSFNNITVEEISDGIRGIRLKDDRTELLIYVDTPPEGYEELYPDHWNAALYGKTHSIVEDTNVDDTFGTWYIANTNYNEVNPKPLAEIIYNGETIAQLNAGETATLSCEGKKMASDVVVKVNEVESKIPEGYIKPEGSLSITENGTYPVTDKEEVVVDVPIPEGYVKPEGTLNILQNNTTYDVSQYAEVRIATAHPYEVPLEMLMNNVISDASQATIGNVYKYTGETTDTYEYGALYILEEVSE